MDTEETYRRGIADAELGEPNPFYYQHYYHYRRGYDAARRRLRRNDPAARGGWGVLLLSLVVLAALGFFGWRWLEARPRTNTVAALIGASTAVSVPSAVVPTNTPIFPTATPEPTPPSPVLGAGGHALVANTQGQALRARRDPSLKAPVTATFKEGDSVNIVEGPTDADGYTWWRVELNGNSGWSAQQSKEGVVWLQPQ